MRRRGSDGLSSAESGMPARYWPPCNIYPGISMLEVRVRGRVPVERRRCGRRPGRDLEADHLVLAQDDGLGVTGEQLRPLTVAGVDVDIQLLVGRQREGGHVRGIERLRLAAPGAPYAEELAQVESVVGRRLDVDDVLVGCMHVQPVVTTRVPRGVGDDPDVRRQRGENALVDDL